MTVSNYIAYYSFCSRELPHSYSFCSHRFSIATVFVAMRAVFALSLLQIL
jgi:hypothetical protein